MFLILSIIVATTLASPVTTPQPEVETTSVYTYKPPEIGGCFPLPDPPHGRYRYLNPSLVEPGQEFDELTMEIVCDRGYGIAGGRNRISCRHSFWSTIWFTEGKCERFCAIPDDSAVEYRCPVKVYGVGGMCFQYMAGGLIHRLSCPIPEGADKGYRPCKEFEPNGTVVQPVCKGGGPRLPTMTCFGGDWDRVPSCQSEAVETTTDSGLNETDSGNE